MGDNHPGRQQLQSKTYKIRDGGVDARSWREFVSSNILIWARAHLDTRLRRIVNAYVDDKIFSVELVGAVRCCVYIGLILL